MSEASAVTRNESSFKLVHGDGAVDQAKSFAELAVACCDFECRQATAMVVWELAENLLKYGASDATAGAGTIAISVVDNWVRVRTTSSVHSAHDARHVQETVSRISNAASASDLYRERLGELFDDPSQRRVQLGLLRIAVEGGFALSCRFEAPHLEIVAERRCTRQ